MAQERLLIRVSEAAERLGISRTKAYELAKAGALPGTMKVGLFGIGRNRELPKV
jgi:excisionase family DNA binding protein